MAGKRSKERDKARQVWLASSGEMTAKEVAGAVGVKPEQVRKWKSLDKWQAVLDAQKPPRKRGGQPGNKNAAGAGAPKGNRNAETHGAYAKVRLEDLTPEQRAYIQQIGLDTKTNMLAELQSLMAKEFDLQNKIASAEREGPDRMYIDKIVEIQKKEDEAITQTVIKGSVFDRVMTLEAELNKIHGRIIKLLDSIKGYELECRRVSLEERKYSLAKQKLTGAFEIDPDTGEINDNPDNLPADSDV